MASVSRGILDGTGLRRIQDEDSMSTIKGQGDVEPNTCTCIGNNKEEAFLVVYFVNNEWRMSGGRSESVACS